MNHASRARFAFVLGLFLPLWVPVSSLAHSAISDQCWAQLVLETLAIEAPRSALLQQKCPPAPILVGMAAIPGATTAFNAARVKLKLASLKGKRVVSLGEGDGGLVEAFRSVGAEAFGVDIQ